MGINATGEGDFRSYGLRVDADREEKLIDKIQVLDEVLAYDAGLSQAPECKWFKLIEPDEQTTASTARIWTVAVNQMRESQLISRDEGRAMLHDAGVFGDLSGPAPAPEYVGTKVGPVVPSAGSGGGDGQPIPGNYNTDDSPTADPKEDQPTGER